MQKNREGIRIRCAEKRQERCVIKNVPLKVKGKSYKTVVKPIVIHGSER